MNAIVRIYQQIKNGRQRLVNLIVLTSYSLLPRYAFLVSDIDNRSNFIRGCYSHTTCLRLHVSCRMSRRDRSISKAAALAVCRAPFE